MQNWLQQPSRSNRVRLSYCYLCGCGIVQQGMSSIHHDPRFRIDVLQDRAGSCRNRNLWWIYKNTVDKVQHPPSPALAGGQTSDDASWYDEKLSGVTCVKVSSRHSTHETEQWIVSDIWLEEMLLLTFCRLWQYSSSMLNILKSMKWSHFWLVGPFRL